MLEGWHGENYLILYDESETSAASESYNIAGPLPGFAILGLCGWDDFIVRDLSGAAFTVPTVPLDREYLEPFDLPLAGAQLEPDPRFTGKIKWYIQPVVFGGDPSKDENMTWVSHHDHAQVVRWWERQVPRTQGPGYLEGCSFWDALRRRIFG